MSLAALILLTLVFAWTAFRSAGVSPADWNIAVLLLAPLTVVLLHRSDAPQLPRWLSFSLLALTAWVAFQLVALPYSLLRLLSPERAYLAAALSPAPYAPLSANPSATLAEWMRLAGCILVFLTVRELAWRYADRRGKPRAPWIVISPLCLIAALEAALGLAQSFSGTAVSAAHGTFANRDHFAAFMEMALPFPFFYGVAALLRGRRRFHSPLRPVLIGCASFSIAALILLAATYSLSRMGFIASLFGLAATSAAFLPRKRWFLALLPAALAFLLYLPPNELIVRFADLSTPDKISAQGRLAIWRDTLPLIARYPLTGCGLGAFESAFNPFKRQSPTMTDTYAHNDYLQYLAELGIPGYVPGLLLVAGLLVSAARSAARHPDPARRALARACLAAAAALLLHSFVDFNTYVPANAFAFAWIAALTTVP